MNKFTKCIIEDYRHLFSSLQLFHLQSSPTVSNKSKPTGKPSPASVSMAEHALPMTNISHANVPPVLSGLSAKPKPFKSPKTINTHSSIKIILTSTSNPIKSITTKSASKYVSLKTKPKLSPISSFWKSNAVPANSNSNPPFIKLLPSHFKERKIAAKPFTLTLSRSAKNSTISTSESSSESLSKTTATPQPIDGSIFSKEPW